MKVLTIAMTILAAANVAFANAATAVSSPENETVATTADIKKEIDKKWSVSLLQETYVGASDANRGEFRNSQADAYIGLGYKLNDTQKVEFRQNFTMNWTDAERVGEYAVYDPAVVFTDTEAYKVNNTPITQQFRLYAPMNENSVEIGQVQARWGLSFDQVVNANVTMSYANTVRAYFYSDQDGQDALRNYTSATATYKVNDIVSPYMELGYIGRFRHTGSGVRGLDEDAAASNPDNVAGSVYLDLGANISAGPIGITVYVDQDHSVRGKEQFVLGNEDELTYSMVLTTSL